MQKIAVKTIKSNLEKQYKTIEEIHTLQKKIYSAVLKRDWMETEKALHSIRNLSKQFLENDKEIYTLIGKFNNNADAVDFFEFTNSLNKNEKFELETIYKKLQNKMLRSKMENEMLSNYISHAQSLIQGVVDIISEDMHGKCYTNTGKHIPANIKSLIVNKTL